MKETPEQKLHKMILADPAAPSELREQARRILGTNKPTGKLKTEIAEGVTAGSLRIRRAEPAATQYTALLDSAIESYWARCEGLWRLGLRDPTRRPSQPLSGTSRIAAQCLPSMRITVDAPAHPEGA